MRSTDRNRRAGGRRGAVKATLGVGFLALAGAILAANGHQPIGYELSIYGGTPLAFWVGIGTATAISLVVAFYSRPGRLRTAALALGGIAVAAVAALPFLRGYFFHGTADALTHLGWARDIATGAMAPTELFYPGVHAFAALLTSFTGFAIERSVMLVVLTMTVVGIAFIPLAVRSVSRSDVAVVVGAFSAFLLFMVHNLGVYVHAHSFSQATFFSALLLYLVFVYLTTDSPLSVGILLAVASLAVVVIHPQQAANMILIFAAVSAVQLYHRRYWADQPIATHRTLYAHTAFIAAAFVVWVTRFEGWAFYNLSRVGGAVVAYLSGRPPVAGGSFQSQAASLTAIGSGLPEIFVKMFLVATVYTLLTGWLMTSSIIRTADDSRPTANAVATYLAIGTVAVLPVVVAYFAGNIAEHYFRHIGFLLLIATIVGALAITRGFGRLSRRRTPRWAATALVVAFAIMLPLSLATVFPSPFIYKQTQHVSEPQMDGYATVFEVNDESLDLGGIRQGPWRYSDAIEGVADRHRYGTTVPNEALTRLPAYYEGEGGYLVVTDRDRAREVQAYEGLRYTQASFDSLDSQAGVNRVVANDALRLYQVPGSTA